MAKKRYTPEAIIHKLRDVEILPVIKEAEVIIEHRRNHYNTKRPHSALGYRPPAPEVVLPRKITDELEKGQKAAWTNSTIGPVGAGRSMGTARSTPSAGAIFPGSGLGRRNYSSQSPP